MESEYIVSTVSCSDGKVEYFLSNSRGEEICYGYKKTHSDCYRTIAKYMEENENYVGNTGK